MFFRSKKKSSAPERPETPLILEAQQSAPEAGLAVQPGPQPVADAQAPADPGKPDPRRRRRPGAGAGKTRLMGFDTSDGRVVGLFDEDNAEIAQHGRCAFPVAWIIVAAGPGRGECFALMSGMSQIGRGEDQTIRLDFGDMAISRSNHAAIVYDPAEHGFLLGHGGKANLVRLNGKPLVSTEPLTDGDRIEIGETRLLFKSLCTAEFNWTEAEDQGDEDDVEIA